MLHFFAQFSINLSFISKFSLMCVKSPLNTITHIKYSTGSLAQKSLQISYGSILAWLIARLAAQPTSWALPSPPEEASSSLLNLLLPRSHILPLYSPHYYWGTYTCSFPKVDISGKMLRPCISKSAPCLVDGLTRYRIVSWKKKIFLLNSEGLFHCLLVSVEKVQCHFVFLIFSVNLVLFLWKLLDIYVLLYLKVNLFPFN